MPSAFAFNLYALQNYKILDISNFNSLENIVGKEENAGNQHFLLFPQCFQLYHKEKLSFK